MPGSRCFDVMDPDLDLMKNYFLEASAGTGKTFTIENLVRRLIQKNIPLSRILIVTFTKAATVELKTRIRKQLSEHKIDLLGFDEAKIFTIHGFCFHILKEFAIETGFSLIQSEESASHETVNRILKDFLRTELYEEEIHPKQLEKLLGKFQFDLDKLLAALSGPLNNQYTRGRAFQEIFNEIQNAVIRLKRDQSHSLDQLLKAAPLFGKMCDRKKQLKPGIEKGLVEFSQLLGGNFEYLFDLPILKMVPENLLKGNSYPHFLEEIHTLLIPLLHELCDTNCILNRLVERARHFLSSVAEEEDLFFYDDLLTSLQNGVKNVVLANQIREQYDAVLIDEFQDTDPIQWKIFSTLFLGHKSLYLVGDPKQSIYRFRGADLYTYMEAQKELGLESKATLTKNYRSDPKLVSGLNFLFKRTPDLITLPKTGEILEIAEVKAARKEPSTPGLSPGIIFCQAENEGMLFSYIAKEIAALHEQGVPFHDFAILVKDRYQAKRFCESCPLPTAPKRSESLLESEALPVLEDLIKAAYNPRERQLLLKVLGGPLFNFPLVQLSSCLEKNMEKFYGYHHLLETEGILSLLKEVICDAGRVEKNLYLDMRQLAEILSEHADHIDQLLPLLEELKQKSPETDLLKTRAKSIQDAIQVMSVHISKGLEFEAVFPIALIASTEIKDAEEYSEKMRQLYVALTRAKSRLYLPVLENEKSPMHFFLKACLQGQPLSEFVASHPSFSLEICQNNQKTVTRHSKIEKITLPNSPLLDFQPISIHSYTSLLSKQNQESSPLILPEKEIPAGSETGILLHQIFEKISFSACQTDLQRHIERLLKGTHLEPWQENIFYLVKKTLTNPLPAPSGPFSLQEIRPDSMIKEMEFLYPNDHPSGFLKGFVDLFFEHKGRYYLIDWKSNFLESYTQQHLQEAIQKHGYDLQAKIYQNACKKYLKLFDCEDKFECGFYIFLRGAFNNSKGIFLFT